MAWRPDDVARHNKRAAKGGAVRKRQWTDVANAVLNKTGDEGRAIREANAATDRSLRNVSGRRRNPKA